MAQNLLVVGSIRSTRFRMECIIPAYARYDRAVEWLRSSRSAGGRWVYVGQRIPRSVEFNSICTEQNMQVKR